LCFLRRGVIAASLREDGTTPFRSELLNISVTIGEISDKHDFSGDDGIGMSELLEDLPFYNHGR